jgi:hypothetical protein
VRDLVALVLDVQDPTGPAIDVVVMLQQFEKFGGSVCDLLG